MIYAKCDQSSTGRIPETASSEKTAGQDHHYGSHYRLRNQPYGFSTGFGGGGATFEDIELFSKHIGPNVKMKAAGGISSLDDAEKFLSLGADRLGTSRIIKIVKNEEATGY